MRKDDGCQPASVPVCQAHGLVPMLVARAHRAGGLPPWTAGLERARAERASAPGWHFQGPRRGYGTQGDRLHEIVWDEVT